jgi:CRP-like cAMP-binding protein
MSLAELARSPSPSPVWPVAGQAMARSPAEPDMDEDVLRRIGSKIRYSRGETIFNEGDLAEFAYKVAHGTVRLCKHLADGRRQIAQFLMPGDFFSFMELSEHSFTAEAVSDVTLVSYPRRQLERVVEERPNLRRRFTALLSKTIHDSQNHLVILGRQTAKEKVSSFLIMLAERQSEDAGALIDIRMSRQDIADYLGLTIETVCRVLSDMRRTRLIDIPNLHQLTIRNSDALEDIADGVE